MRKIILILMVMIFCFVGAAFASGENCTADYQCGPNGYCFKKGTLTFGVCK